MEGLQFVDSGAEFSACRLYRYRLWRMWGQGKPLAFIMLNPSTADETTNDPTVERCERRARKMGYGGLIVGNVYALRSTDPKALYASDDPVGPENDRCIQEIAKAAGMVVCGWGQHSEKVRKGRAESVLDLIRAAGKVPHALKVSKNGAPWHPLYVGYDVLPRPYAAQLP